MSISRTISEIFVVKEWRDLETVSCSKYRRSLTQRSRPYLAGQFDCSSYTTLRKLGQKIIFVFLYAWLYAVRVLL